MNFKKITSALVAALMLTGTAAIPDLAVEKNRPAGLLDAGNTSSVISPAPEADYENRDTVQIDGKDMRSNTQTFPW